MTSTLPASHAAFLDHACGILSADCRIHFVLAGGSMVHGGMDAFSEFDFVLVVEEDAYTEVQASRMEVARPLGFLLSAFTGEHVGEPRLLICLYGQFWRSFHKENAEMARKLSAMRPAIR